MDGRSGERGVGCVLEVGCGSWRGGECGRDVGEVRVRCGGGVEDAWGV